MPTPRRLHSKRHLWLVFVFVSLESGAAVVADVAAVVAVDETVAADAESAADQTRPFISFPVSAGTERAPRHAVGMESAMHDAATVVVAAADEGRYSFIPAYSCFTCGEQHVGEHTSGGTSRNRELINS